MDCLALVLQPIQGPDILLQTKSWFPPARAKAASLNFRQTRAVDSLMKQQQQRDPGSQQAMMLDRLGDDPLAAASGQVIVGGDRSYRVVYRLVNTIYVLGIALADDDDTENVFHCITAVNQAVSVLVAAARGVDVTPEKVFRKYTEIYLALRYILNGIGGGRLADVLSAVQGDGSALLSPLPFTLIAERENRSRGSTHWANIRTKCVQRLANMEILSTSHFELSEETLACGDEALEEFAPPPTQGGFEKLKSFSKGTTSAENDPFAASDSLLLLGATGPDPSQDLLAFSQADPNAAPPQATRSAPDPAAMLLAELEAPGAGGGDPFGADPVAEVFGAEADGAVFGEESSDDAWGSAFGGSALLGGDSDAWGGGLDAAEFGFDETETLKGLDGDVNAGVRPALALEAALGLSGPAMSAPAAAVAKGPELPKVPTFRFEERISVEFAGPTVKRVRLQGSLFLGHPLKPPSSKPLALKAKAPPTPTGPEMAADFSFRLDGSAGIYRAVVRSEVAENLGRGYFRAKLPAVPLPCASSGEEEGAQADFLGDIGQESAQRQWAEYCILKYRLLPRFTPIPLRVRLISRKTEDTLTLMIQYVANPYLQHPLEDVVFVLAMPFSPASLKLSPAADLDPWTKELRWKVPPIRPDGPPQRLRAQIPYVPEKYIRPPPETKAKDGEGKAKEKAQGKSEEAKAEGNEKSGDTAADKEKAGEKGTEGAAKDGAEEGGEGSGEGDESVEDGRTEEEKREEEERKAEEERLAKLLASFKVRVSFSSTGSPLSGISILEAVVSNKPPFLIDDKSSFKADSYLCSHA